MSRLAWKVVFGHIDSQEPHSVPQSLARAMMTTALPGVQVQAPSRTVT